MDDKIINKIAWWIPNKHLRKFFKDFCYEHNEIYIQNKNIENMIAYMLSRQNFDDDRIYNILLSRDYNFIYSQVYDLWYKHFDEKILLNLLYFISKKNDIWWNINNNFWLIYISLLYEYNEINKAQELLYQYIEKFDLLDIHRFLLVSELSFKLKIVDENIEKSVFIKNRLDESIKNNTFENIIKGKSVAIVGNGPQEIGKGKGTEIDSYDIVIRFNNYNTDGFEKDYGSKTDICIHNGNIKTTLIKRDKLKLYCFEPDFYHFSIEDYMYDSLLYYIYKKENNIYYYDKNIHIDLSFKMNNNSSTSGALTIYKILQMNKQVLNLDNIYGFSFKNNDFNNDKYHFYNDNVKNVYPNNMYNEIKFLRKLFNLDN